MYQRNVIAAELGNRTHRFDNIGDGCKGLLLRYMLLHRQQSGFVNLMLLKLAYKSWSVVYQGG
jgi:hypothetical protein